MKTAATLRLVGHFLVAVLACTVLGTVVQTQFNLAELQRLGVDIPVDVRLKTIAADLLGFSPNFGPIVLVGFAIAFAAAGALCRRTPAWCGGWFVVAGAAAIFTAMALMSMIFEITPVAAVRGPVGLTALCACGAVGGHLFRRLRMRR